MTKVCRALVLMLGATSLACAHRDKAWPDASTWRPGQVLSESSEPLGNGYKAVRRSIVSPPGHWEGVGHFGFVSFGDTPLCQCSADEVARSPDGRFAIYAADQTGSLTLFHALKGQTTILVEESVGLPHTVEWDLESGRAKVTVRRWAEEDGRPVDQQISVVLTDRP